MAVVTRKSVFRCLTGVFLLLPIAGGCGKKFALPPTPTPTVTVSKPVEREVTDFVEFTGRTDAVFSTEIRPRVTGYLVGMRFKEGAIVKKDQTLFEIDDELFFRYRVVAGPAR